MKKSILYTTGLIVSAMFLFTGCSDDENPEPGDDNSPIETGYAISTVSGAFPDQTTYIQWMEDIDLSTIGNDQAIELTGRASTVSYGRAVYATPFGAPANLVKYVVGSDSIPSEEQRIVVPGSNTFSTLYFKSETEAYATVSGGISKLIIFDPSTMRITDEVSLSTVTTKFPQATRTYYLDMLERDDKLFMGVHYENNFAPVNDSAYVAVIDLTTNAVEKVLSDGRTGMVFGGETAPCMALDDNGDIYIQALGTFNVPSGVLRIKNGQVDFDEDYFFNLEEVVGNICYGIYPMADGLTFTKRVEDETDFWEFSTGQPQFKYFKIDLPSGTSEGVVEGLPTSYKRSMLVKSFEDGTLLFTTSTNEEHAVYAYDIATGDVSEKFTSTGGYITGLEKLE